MDARDVALVIGSGSVALLLCALTMLYPTRKTLAVYIRWLIRLDMDEVLLIERSSFEFPWREADFVRCLRQRNCIGMVAESLAGESANRVVGFVIYEVYSSRIELLNLAVHPDVRRRGVGRQLMAALYARLSAQRTRIGFHVRETNLPAQQFFRAIGCKATGVVPRCYDEPPDEAAFRFVLRQGQFIRAVTPESLEDGR